MIISLIDYGAGNLTSVIKGLRAVGAEVRVVARPDGLGAAEAIVIPGVGHFDATRALGDDWRAAVRMRLDAGVPLLGICLGLQWLFEGSAEAPGLPGLGVMTGLCDRLPAAETMPDGRSQALKIPHVGWNSLHFPRQTTLFECVNEGAQVYFTHTYAAPVTEDAAAVTVYGVPFASAVERGQVFGVQFHPEKSGDVGLQVLRNFLRVTKTE
jgi:glutamine amidotransferase